MFNCSKYIVVSDINGYLEKMIIFPDVIKHKDIAKAMERIRYPNLVSAGFISELLQCYGSSTSTQAFSRGEVDTKLLHKQLQIEDKEIKFK